jgi:single-stranded DNA-binding protein
MAMIFLTGRLGAAPQTKKSKSGNAYLEFSLAEGSKTDVVWYQCFWDKLNAPIVAHLTKGSAVAVSGKLLKPQPFQKKDGSHDCRITIMVTTVDFLPTSKIEGEGPYAAEASVFGNENSF